MGHGANIYFQAIRYVLSGIVVLALDFVTFIIYVAILPNGYIVGNMLGKTVGAISGFLLHKAYSFGGQQEKHVKKQFLYYLLLYGVNVLLSSLIIYVCVSYLDFLVVVSKIVADVAVTVFSFIVSRAVIFNGKNESNA